MGGAEAATGYIDPLNNRKMRFSDITDKDAPSTFSGDIQNISNMEIYPNETYTFLNSSEVEFHPNYAGHLYLGKNNIFYRSTDNGLNFDTLYSFASSARVLTFEISISNPQVIYCIVRDNSQSRIHKSTDGGNNFALTTDVPSNTISRMDLSLDPSDENNLWVISGNGANGKKVYCTKDGGTTWINKTTSVLDGHQLRDILYQAGTNDVVYVTSSEDLFYWDDSTSNWVLYRSGLPVDIRPIALKPFYRDSKLRLATSKGIWEAPLAQASLPEANPLTYYSTVSCARDTVQFEDYSVLKHANATWHWEIIPSPSFIDTENSRNPKIVFGASGDYDVILTVTDSLGNVSKDTALGMVTVENQCFRDSVAGKSLLCASSSDYVLTPYMDLNQTKTVTISAWIKPNGIKVSSASVVMNNTSAAGLNFRSNNMLGYHWPGGSWSWNSGLVVDDSVWTHVAIVVTPTSVTLYKNAESATHNTNVSAVDLDQLSIGRYKNWSGRNYIGEIDEVCIWNRSLSASEIRELRHLTRTGSMPYDSSLVAYYQFNSNSSFAQDRVGIMHASYLGNATTINSTAPVGGGESYRLTVSQAGQEVFGSTELKADFGTVHPNGEVVATRLNVLPDSLPLSTPSAGQYWIINNYGTGNFSSLDSLILKPKVGIPVGSVANMRLYIRGENEHLNNWVNKCQAVSKSEGSYKFDNTCSITNTGQFFVQSTTSDEIRREYRTVNIDTTICSLGSIFLEGAYQNTAGTYYDTVSVSPSIDSVFKTVLSVSSILYSTDIETSCDSFTWINGETYFASTNAPKDTFTSVDGCDSVVSLSLTIHCPCSPSRPLVSTLDTLYKSTQSVTDSAGWTHYCTIDDELLISLKLGGTGALVEDTAVSVKLGPSLTQSWTGPGGIITNMTGGARIYRSWEVSPVTQPTSEVGVRYYFTNQEYVALVDTLANHNGGTAGYTTTVTSPSELSMYKINSSGAAFQDPHSSGVTGIVITYDTIPTTTTWKYNSLEFSGHEAEFTVSGFSGGGGGVGVAQSALPVGLVEFSAVAIPGHRAILSWSLASELNNSHFIVQRSYDAESFDSIGRINGNGTTQEKSLFEYIDDHIEKSYNKVYYRLLQVDFDGAIEQLPLRDVVFKGREQIFVWPNPSSNLIHVYKEQQNRTANSELKILDVFGKNHANELTIKEESDGYLVIDIQSLSDGMYTLVLGKSAVKIMKLSTRAE